MVQLKSFRFIEPEGGLNQQVNLTNTDTEDGRRHTLRDISNQERMRKQDTELQYSPASSSSTTTISSSSSKSISSIAGGNLTVESGSQQETPITPDSMLAEGAKQKKESGSSSGSVSASSSEEETNTTLSTNEECQQSKYDIEAEAEGEAEAEEETRIEMKPDASIPEDNVDDDDVVIKGKRQSYTKKTTSNSQQQAKLAQQKAQNPQFSKIIAQSPAQLRSLSPVLMARQAKIQQQAAGDSISQYSFATQPRLNNSNHFEIRWRNINLMARRSKLPKFIADNKLYKLIKGNKGTLDGSSSTTTTSGGFQDNKVYYSPPLNKRVISVIPEIGSPPEIETLKQVEQSSSNNLDQLFSTTSQEYRQIIKNISGSVFSGQLTAILGPSGVGKTSLLNSLTGRNTLEGTGRVNLLGGSNRKRMSVVNVPQADVLPEKLTALEDLKFTSRLKNPQRGFDHERNIQRIVRHLQMEKFLNTRIEKLSGGEARRLSIGRELLNSPDIMILDEPTSGLDANTCKKIITALRDIVEHSDNILDKPMTIIVTIHQPQQEVLNLFHRLYIMALGGCAIYEGPPSNLLSHLLEHSNLSRATDVAQLNENPAIVAIEVASGEYGPEIIAELADYHELSAGENYANDELNDQLLMLGQSPYMTPRSLRSPRKSPMSASPAFSQLHRAHLRAGSSGLDGISLGSPRTPVMGSGKRFNQQQQQQQQQLQFDKMSNVTSVSYASTYDADLPEPISKLKVDKRLRRSVVMKGDFISHTWTLMRRCWLLTTRDFFLMAVRFIGFLLIAGGIVQIYSHALDGQENQCPIYQSELEDFEILRFMNTMKHRLLGVRETLTQASSTHTLFFHLILCVTIVSSALSGLIFPLQMRMFVREYKNGWYSPSSFIASSTLAELPIDMVGPTLTVLIMYPLCHQPASEYHWRELGYILVLILSTLICKSQAQIVGSFLMKSVENSVFLSCVVVTPPALLSGVAIRVSQMSLPLQWLSYGSFLRYTFECLFLLRYGYGICPCDQEIVHGYPIKPSATAIPENLNNFARGVIDLNGGGNFTLIEPTISGESGQMVAGTAIDEFDDNLFVRYIRLVSDASNMFVPNAQELGDCDNYRSLYLLSMGIDDRKFFAWTGILVFIFILSRIITYFVVKTVIKMHRE